MLAWGRAGRGLGQRFGRERRRGGDFAQTISLSELLSVDCFSPVANGGFEGRVGEALATDARLQCRRLGTSVRAVCVCGASASFCRAGLM